MKIVVLNETFNFLVEIILFEVVYMSKKFIKVLDNYMAKGIKLYLISNEVYVGFNDRMKDPTRILVKSRVFI